MKTTRAESAGRRFLTSVDDLALIRTKLANERTFLAYLRTFVGSFVAGIGLIEFTGNLLSLYTGFVLLVAAPVILVVGIVRVIGAKKEIGRSFLSGGNVQKEETQEEQREEG